MKRVFNFGAGPAMLPLEVMQQAQAEFLNYQNLGASVIEISHRSVHGMGLKMQMLLSHVV